MDDFDIANERVRGGDFLGALPFYEAAIAARPDHAAAHLNRGVALASLGRLDDALAGYNQALALNPASAEALANRGAAHSARREFARAERDFAAALAVRPTAAAQRQRGDALMELRRFDEALASYDAALAIDPEIPLARRHRGHALMRLERKTEALEVFAHALERAPQDADALADCGWALFELRQLDDSLAAYDRATARAPGNAAHHYNRALALVELGRIEAAIEAFGRAIALRPDHVGAHVNRGFCRLLLGDFAGGFPDYEWRNPHDLADLDPERRLDVADIPALSGRRVLALSEIGLGDTLHFARYIAELEVRGAKVIVDVEPKLQKILGTLDARFAWGNRRESRGAFDGWTRMISLPHLVGETPDSHRAPRRYLSAEPGRVAKWRARVGPRGFKIGICWRGQARPELFPRSFPLSALAALGGLPEVRLISLRRQSDDDAREIAAAGFAVETLGPDYDADDDAFLDAAAMIDVCDLVVTCDTSLAHLAGALGAPTWLALKYVADWRWLRGRDDSPWYPSLRLFRQSAPGDWASAFAPMAQALREQLHSLGNSSPMAR